MRASKEALGNIGLGKAGVKERQPGGKRKKVVGAVAAALRVEPPVQVVVVEVPAKTEANQFPFHGIDGFFSELNQQPAVISAREELREVWRLSQAPLKPNQHKLEEGKGIAVSLFWETPSVANSIIDSLNKSSLLVGTWSGKDRDGVTSIDTIFPGVRIEVKELSYDGKVNSHKGVGLDLSKEAIAAITRSPALPAL